MAAFPTIAQLEAALAARPAPAHAEVFAAVALCLRERDGGVELVLARRAVRAGDPWSGQIGLPGGRVEPGDRSPLETARRETLEEVGFDPLREGRLLGVLEPVPGRHDDVRVAPFVVAIETDVEPSPSAELPSVWWARTHALSERRVRVREVPFPVPAFVGSASDGRTAVVWGMTHRLLVAARGLGLSGDAEPLSDP